MKRIFALILLLCFLMGMGPAQRRVATCGPLCSQSRLDNYIIAHSPTLLQDPDNVQYVTRDSVERVSSISPRYGSTAAFTQATDGNKPVLSRPDRVENLLLYSSTFNAAAWTSSDVSFSSPTLTASATNATHQLRSNYTAVAGERLRCSYELGYDNYQFAIFGDQSDAVVHVLPVDLTLGTIGAGTNVSSASITTISAGRFLVSFEFTRTNAGTTRCAIAFGSSLADIAFPTLNTAGTEKISVYSAQLQRSSMQPTYIATTTVPVYGSLTGRRMLTFDGTNDYMSSTSALSDIYGASAKTFFGLVNTNLLNTYQEVLDGSGGSQFAVRILNSGSSIQAFNADGAVDYAAATITANAPNAVVVTHDGTNLAIAVNRGAFTSTASGASSALTETIRLGAWGSGTSPFNGQLGRLVLFNRVLPQPAVDTIARGEIKFNLMGQ